MTAIRTIGITGASAAAVALLILLGYSVFRLFAVEVLPNPASVGFLLFAVVAAVGSFFSPCSFPLLPGYLTHYAEVAAPPNGGGNRRVLAGWVAALGVLTFSLLLAAVVAALGTAVTGALSVAGSGGLPLRTFRGAVGAFLIGVGLSYFAGRGLNFHRLVHMASKLAELDNSRPWRGLYLYGFGYQAVGIGCSGPFLSGLVVFALASGGFAAAFAGFTVYALTMTGLMLAASLAVGFATQELVRGLSRAAPSIKRTSGAIQVAVGAFLVFSSVFVEAFVRTFFP